ncbi:MAG: DUF4153 domain-containing protein, partial [Dehalococcoidia bacterium]
MTAAAGTLATSGRTLAARETAIIAVALGLFADVLFREASLGLNAPLWIGALLAAIAVTRRHRTERASGAEVACLAVSFAAAAALAWRGSPALQALLFLASGAFLVLAVAVRAGLPWRRAGVALFLGTMVATGLAIAAAAARVDAALELRGRALRQSRDGLGTVLRIVLIGGPVLLVFAVLFASADAVFEERLRWLTNVDLSGIAPHVFWFVAGAWFAGGVTWTAFEGRIHAVPQPQLPEARRLGLTEVASVLGALAALFAAFVAIQLRYLFGGHDLVQQTIGLTYAEYARRGFFELVTTAVLLLPLLLLADWARRADARTGRVYRVIAGVLVSLLFVIVASALMRMDAYEQAYGLTEPRLYAVAILVGLSMVFLLFLRTLVRGTNEWFVAGSLGAVVVVLATLTALGPDALIARRNLDRAATHPFDAQHAASLGAEAVPVLVARIEVLRPDDACTVARELLERWGDGSGDGLRSWNWSRAAAADAVDAARPELTRTC